MQQFSIVQLLLSDAPSISESYSRNRVHGDIILILVAQNERSVITFEYKVIEGSYRLGARCVVSIVSLATRHHLISIAVNDSG